MSELSLLDRDAEYYARYLAPVHEKQGFTLVGHGKVTNPLKCGRFWTYFGCIRTDLHNFTTLEGKNYAGKAYISRVHHWCHKPSCPICYENGWALREAGQIEARLVEASKQWGQIEHLTASVPPKDYGLSFERLRKKVLKVLKSRGVIGGTPIFHAFRYRPVDEFKDGVLLPHGWFWSPHFHVLGFIKGGYGQCRNCPHKNACVKGCGGFDDRAWRLFQKDRWYVKVFGERKTIFGTAWYQLNHASYKRGVRRFHVNTWFGVVSYRRMKRVPVPKKESVCPLCAHELVELRYVGSKEMHGQFMNEAERKTFEDYREGVDVAWIEKPKRDGIPWVSRGIKTH